MEDSLLFPLSPTDDLQRLKDDSMECAAASLLLADDGGCSLFNDSLDGNDPILSKMADNLDRVGSSTPDQNLDDSLDFDTTQLPYEKDSERDEISRDSSSEKPKVFELASNIPVSLPQEGDAEKDGLDTTPTVEPIQPQLRSPPLVETGEEGAAAGRTTAVVSVSKVVPNFGKRKAKSTKSPSGTKTKVNNSPATDTHKNHGITNVSEEESAEGKAENETEDDQCVPQATNKPENLENPSSTDASKNKPSQKKASTTAKEKTMEKSTSKDENENLEHSEKKGRASGGKKEAEKEKKKQEREQKKREVEKKKQEREQKRMEAEAKKAERERLKKEKQLEVEKKKAEREQKKIEQALKKAEKTTGKKQEEGKGRKKKEDTSGCSKEESTSEDIRESQSGNQNDSVLGMTEPEEGASVPTKDSASMPENSEPVAACRDTPSPLDVVGLDLSQSSPQLPRETAEEGVYSASPGGDQPTTNKSGITEEDQTTEDSYNTQGQGTPTREDTENLVGGNTTGSSSSPSSGCTTGSSSSPSSGCTTGSSSSPSSVGTCSVSVKKLKIVFGKSRKPNTSAGALSTEKIIRKLDSETITVQKKGTLKPLNQSTECPKKDDSKKTKKRKPKRLDSSEKENDRVTKRKRRKRKRNEEEDEEEEGSRMGPVWVQCERSSCKKWRKLRDCSDPLSLPDSWTCSMNTDPARSTCSAEEESWSDEVGENQEFVETPFIPGSLVWAKMDSYPWWPAMIEDDPDDDTYYKLGKRSQSSNIPVKYHVVFLDTPVSRGWISGYHVAPYHYDDTDRNMTNGVTVPQKLRAGLKEAKKMAKRAASMDISTRMVEYSFSKRFHRKSSKRRRKTLCEEDDDEEEDSCSRGSKRSNTPSSSSERSSARLAGKTTQEEEKEKVEEKVEAAEVKEEEEEEMKTEEEEETVEETEGACDGGQSEINLKECVSEEVEEEEQVE